MNTREQGGTDIRVVCSIAVQAIFTQCPNCSSGEDGHSGVSLECAGCIVVKGVKIGQII